MHWQIYDHYGYALVAVIGTFVALIAIQWLITHQKFSQQIASLQGVAPPFINIVGVLFALTLAFLANDTWIAHDRAVKAVYKEADALHAITALTQQLPTSLQTEVAQAVHAYAQATADEWVDLAHRQTNITVEIQSDKLFRILGSPAIHQSLGQTVQALLLKKMEDIREERDQRVALSQTHVNPLKWLGMGFLGLLTLISVAIVHIDKPRAAFVSMLLFSLAAAPTAAIVLIQGNPFQQPTSVLPTPILSALSDHPKLSEPQSQTNLYQSSSHR